MKRPDGIELLTLAEDDVGSGGAYPPLGFNCELCKVYLGDDRKAVG